MNLYNYKPIIINEEWVLVSIVPHELSPNNKIISKYDESEEKIIEKHTPNTLTGFESHDLNIKKKISRNSELFIQTEITSSEIDPVCYVNLTNSHKEKNSFLLGFGI